jgi:thiol-disulfide isomerase/thioredoxin
MLCNLQGYTCVYSFNSNHIVPGFLSASRGEKRQHINLITMKNIYLLAAIIVLAACQRAMLPANTPIVNAEIKNESGQIILAGHCSPSALQQPNYKSWFDNSYDSYAIDGPGIEQLKPLLKGKTMEIFLGSWCGDSKREVPRMMKILDNAGVDSNKVTLIFVDNSTSAYKQSPQHEEKDKNIHHVPTFIVYDGSKEMGRIVESPLVSLEKDLLAILQQQAYQPNYKAIEYWRTHVRSRDKNMADGELYGLVTELKPITKHYGEFNAYAHMQFAAQKTKEAINVFRLNTILYPDNANAFSNLGEALATSGSKTEAVAAYEKALVLKPGDENLKKKIVELKM